MKTIPTMHIAPGTIATGTATFGPRGRYRVAAYHTRFGGLEWHVTDAETIDPVFDCPQVIRQQKTLGLAVEGLATPTVTDEAIKALQERSRAASSVYWIMTCHAALWGGETERLECEIMLSGQLKRP